MSAKELIKTAVAGPVMGELFRMRSVVRADSVAIRDVSCALTLAFVDRKKYLIKSGGENIYPAEIEKILLRSDRIAEASVVRKPDPKWGEVPAAFIVRRDPTLTEADVVDLCRGEIAGYKLPKDVRFVDAADIPRSETGKIKRYELERMLDG